MSAQKISICANN